MTSQPFMVIPVPLQTAKRWLRFKANDVEILTDYFYDKPKALLVMQINSGNQLRKLLETIGYYYTVEDYEAVFYRTHNKTVMKWSVMWDAVSFKIKGHHPRFGINIDSAPLFRDIITRAYSHALTCALKKA